MARIERGVEVADRSHDLDNVTGAKLLQRERGEDAARKAFHRHAQLPRAGGAADGVAASGIVAGRLASERNVLPVREREVARELGRNVERDHN